MADRTAPGRAAPSWRFLPALLSLAVAVSFARFGPMIEAGGEAYFVVDWLPAFGVQAAFRMDGLSFAFTLLVSGIGALVFLYAAEYFKHDHRLARLLALLTIFQIAMLGLVTADDVITFFVFWEGTTVASFLLVGFDHHKAEARAKALQALLITAGGGLALLAGLIVVGEIAGTYRFSEMVAHRDLLRESAAYAAFMPLILAGCFTKSAQVPFHFWLPNAMAAPTPVSAYLHSATMVKAGIYLLGRLSPVLGGTEPWIWTLTLVGGATMLLGAVWALRQTDFKLMLAYTTVSGLGSLVMFLGSRDPVAVAAASTFLFVHAFYKAALFLMIGVLDKQAGTREVGRLGGLGQAMPFTWLVGVLAGFSMAGFPPLLGFIGKELKYEGALAVASEPLLVAGIAVLSNGLMVALGVLVAVGPFTGARRADAAAPGDAAWPLMLGPVLLAAGGLAFGLAPGALSTMLIQPMAQSIIGGPVDVQLKLWHGFNLPLLLSIATFGIGLIAWFLLPWLRVGLAAVEPRTLRLEGIYVVALAGLKRAAARTARTAQPGAITFYLRVTLGVLALMLVVALVRAGGVALPAAAPSLPVLEWAVLALMAVGAVLVVATGSRLTSLVALGLVGSGAALVFALYGAVDVAMTQLLVETLVVVIVAVALPRLPPLTKRRSGAGAVVIAGVLGAAVTFALLAVLATPFDRRLTDFHEAAAWPEALGRNVVNVILVDFRALDTFGEILVVAIAGVAAVAALTARRARP